VVPVDVIGKTAKVSVDSVVNLRQSPNTSSTVVRKLVASDTFTIVKVDNDWYQVQLPDGSTGWVAGWLVSAQ
jgi:N-acetylmuramoyl-L-alanine amidase